VWNGSIVREPRAVGVGRDVHINVLLLANRGIHRRQWSNLSAGEVEELHQLLAKALWGDAA
jgi:hypothetical protein